VAVTGVGVGEVEVMVAEGVVVVAVKEGGR